jgi:6-phosphogluconolactonase
VGYDWHSFETPEALAEALAAQIGKKLQAAIDARGEATLTVSGGKTPVLLFPALSAVEIDWSKVTVMLVDDRFVPPVSERSNERLVREKLLQKAAAKARFIGLYSDAQSVEAAASSADARLRNFPFPPDVVVLGIGLDGHTASFFPDAGNLDALLDPGAAEAVLPVHSATAGEPRLTLPLARFIDAPFVTLHIEGSGKRDVLMSALGAASGTAPPVAAVFRHAANPVQIFWAPAKDETT